AIGFSSFAVLAYYAIANASAWTLSPAEHRWPRAFCALGFVGCIVLGFAQPISTVVGGSVLFAVGAIVWFVRRRISGQPLIQAD
nr:amino acid permease [Acidimicrobiia bacterium]